MKKLKVIRNVSRYACFIEYSYTCPECYADVAHKQYKCICCGTELDWKDEDKEFRDTVILAALVLSSCTGIAYALTR